MPPKALQVKGYAGASLPLCHICRASPVMQDRADAVARKVLRLLETGHKELVVALNNALIKEGRFEPAVKMAGE